MRCQGMVQLAYGIGVQVRASTEPRMRLSCGDNVWLLADYQPQGFLDYYT